jgi:hypothetical protein
VKFYRPPVAPGKENAPPQLGSNACGGRGKLGSNACGGRGAKIPKGMQQDYPNSHWRGPFSTTDNFFLPQVAIPASHLCHDVIYVHASNMRSFPGYKLCYNWMENLILLNLDPKLVTHVIFAIAKCTTIRLGLSMEAFTYANPGANLRESPSVRAGGAFSDAIGNSRLNFRNDMHIGWLNACVVCKNDGHGHCDGWSLEDADLAVPPLVEFCLFAAHMEVPVGLPNCGGTVKESIFFLQILAGTV